LISLERIRTIAIIAICSDDYLLDRLVLKGGNALRLLYQIGCRTSLDIDFSINSDFEDRKLAEQKLLSSLEYQFSLNGLALFDAKFFPKPSTSENDWWGGYCVEFKLIDKDKAAKHKDDIEQMRRESIDIDGDRQSSRKFTIDISKHEYTAGKEQAEIEGYICYVYSPNMLAAEKLRAICQQMPEYVYVKAKKRRSRDFYDLHALCTTGGIDFAGAEFQETVKNIFKAKQVPLQLLEQIKSAETKAFHETDWTATRDTITEPKRDFGFYHSFIANKIEALEPLWIK